MRKVRARNELIRTFFTLIPKNIIIRDEVIKVSEVIVEKDF